MIRFFDVLLALVGLSITFPLLTIIFIIGIFDTGSPLFFQIRVGKDKKPFTLIKFRTMSLNTKSVASHLASSTSITTLGKFLRKTKLDELPQLLNVLKGEMSIVGPRPNLYNQLELIDARERKNIFSVRPGITGLAQVQNIDMSSPVKLADIDSKMIKSLSLKNYFLYIYKTVIGSGFGDAINNG